ncbi:hypothetical protein ACHWQZ_G016646 [Mnemiopsis leidyi]
MSNKRSLHMFQQGSPKRRKPFSPQAPDTAENHHKYPITRNSHPPTATQHFNYQPYQRQDLQQNNNQNRNFYEISSNVNNEQKHGHGGSFPDNRPGQGYLQSNQPGHGNFHSNQLSAGIFQRPTNNFGYNPGQTISLQNNQNMLNLNNAQSTMASSGSTVGGGTYGANQFDTMNRHEVTSHQSAYHQENSLYMDRPRVSGQTDSRNNVYQNPPNYPGYATQDPPVYCASPFENKSLLYRMNHTNPAQVWSESHVTNHPGQVSSEQYTNSYNPLQRDSRYQAPDRMQQPVLNHQSRQNLTSNIQYYQQSLSSAGPDALGCNGSRLLATGTGSTQMNRFEFNKNGQTFPTAQYKIDPAQRHLLINKTDNSIKLESKTGDKRKNSDANKLNSGRKRIVTCNVSAMLHWAKLTHSSQFLFEIFGCLNSSERVNDVSYKLQLKDSENNLLEANYYLSSTTQPELITGRYYRVIGKMINKTFLCFKLKEVPYMETRNAVSLIKQSEIAMSKLILQINES